MAAKNKKSKWKKIVIAMVVVVIVLLFLVIRGLASNGEETVMVDTQKVTQEKIVSTLDTSGTVGSEAMKTYSSEVTAEIGEVNVQVGDVVHAGDYLLTYDTASLETSYTQADLEAKASAATANDTLSKSSEGEMKKANAEAKITDCNNQIAAKEADINTLKQNLTNYSVQTNNLSKEMTELQTVLENLSSKQMTGELSAEEQLTQSTAQNRINEINNQNTDIANNTTAIQADLENKQSELADLQSQLAEAQADEASAEAMILSENAKANLDYSSQAAQLTVTQAENQLSIAKAGITAEFDGIVTDVQAVSGAAAAEGQALVTVADSSAMKVDFQVSKYNLEHVEVGQEVTITSLDHEYTGAVEKISKMATASEAGAAMVSATVSIDDPDDNLVIGLDAKLNIILATEENALVVPLTAVNTDVDGDFVYLVKKGVVVRQSVETGISSSDKIQITSGVEEGDEIITSVDSTIKEGITVVTSDSLGLGTAKTAQTEDEEQGTEE